MFGLRKLRKTNQEIKKEVASLRRKSARLYFLDEGTISLFNFNDSNDIRTAVKSVPELASILNYTAKSFSLGEFQILNNDKLIEKHQFYNLLNTPNVLQNSSEFKQYLYENLAAYGVAYIYFDTPGVVTSTKSMSILPTWAVLPFVGDLTYEELLQSEKLTDVIKYFEVNTGLKTFNIPPDNILIITQNTAVSIENQYLIYESPLKPLEKALHVTPAMYDTMQNLMNHGGMKGFISNNSTDDAGTVPINEDEQKSIQKAFRDYGSKEGQYDVAFTNANLNYVAISSRIRDMLLPEQQKMIKTIIADIFGFDTAILNNDDANKYANYKEARKSLFTETIIPTANNCTEKLTSYLLEFRENQKINLDYSALDVFSEDEKLKSEKIAIESTYIINLNKSVIAGEMTKENAVYLLILNGYDELTAKTLIQ